MNGEAFPMYRGRVLKSRDGIPRPLPAPPGLDLAKEARTARSRFYPVTVAYTAYALAVVTIGLGQDRWTAALFVMAGVICWTLVEYLVHRHILHGRFPIGSIWRRRTLHRVFDPSHGDHHLRPWDGQHINGGFDTIPFPVILPLTSFLARGPT